MHELIDKLLPTPTRLDFRDRRPSKNWKGSDLVSKITTSEGISTGMNLQPKFLEWMMGYSINWTELNDCEGKEDKIG